MSLMSLQGFWENIEGFKKGCNNYPSYWLNYPRGDDWRSTVPFQRFIKQYPAFSARVFEKTDSAFKDRHSDIEYWDRLPWPELYASARIIYNSLTDEELNSEGFESGIAGKLRFIKG